MLTGLTSLQVKMDQSDRFGFGAEVDIQDSQLSQVCVGVDICRKMLFPGVHVWERGLGHGVALAYAAQ